MNKIIDCIIMIIIAVALSLLITFLIVGAVLEGDGSTVKYNQVLESGSGNK